MEALCRDRVNLRGTLERIQDIDSLQVQDTVHTSEPNTQQQQIEHGQYTDQVQPYEQQRR